MYPSPGVFRIARPRAECYQLRGLPLGARSSFVHNAIGCSLSNGVGPCHRHLTFPMVSQELTRTAKYDNGTPRRNISNHYMYGKVPISGYQPQVSSDRVSFINIAVRTLGSDQVQEIVVNFMTTLLLPRILTLNSYCSAAASSLSHLQANLLHASHLHLLYCACN